MADTPILAAGTAPLPLDYEVPNAQEIVLKMARAVYNGSTAATPWLPAVTIVSDAGVELGTAFGSQVAAGGSADASFFPRVALASSVTPASGAVVAAFAQASVPFTWGPGNNTPNLGTVVTNDSATFTNRVGHPTDIAIAHGGVIQFYTALEFSTNGGVAYSGIFKASVTLRDSLGTDVDEIAGPIIYYSELYATDPADDFQLSGSTLFNADDTFYTPPYAASVTYENAVNSTAIAAGLAVAIYNPTGLT